MNRTPRATVIATSLLAFGATDALAVEWDVSVWGKRRAFTEHVEKLADLVAEKTDGEFTLNISYGGLSKPRENLDNISFGAIQMAQFCAGYHADKNPSITVLELPFLGVENLEEERRVSMALYDHPAVQKDIGRWNAELLMPTPLPQYNLIGVGDKPTSLSEFEGLSVRATGGIGRAMEAVGAIPTSMSATEVRQALDSGVVKAVAFAPHAHMAFGTVNTGEWWTTNLNPGTVNCPVVANQDALESLSDEHREALMGSIEGALDHYIAYYNNNTMERWGPTLEEEGIETITYSEAEIAEFRDAVAEPAAQAWIEENKAKGLPAQELLDLVKAEIAK